MSSKFLFIKLPQARYSKMSDSELIDLYRQSHENHILDELFNRYVHLIFAVCMKYLKDNALAKDMVLEVFSGLHDKLIRFDISNFKAWLHMVTRNQCLMALRKKTVEVHVEDEKIFQNFAVENEPFEHPEDDREQEFKKLRGFVTRLKDGQKVCLELMYFNDMSYQQIAEHTGFTLKQVKSFIQNGKRNLRLFFEGNK